MRRGEQDLYVYRGKHRVRVQTVSGKSRAFVTSVTRLRGIRLLVLLEDKIWEKVRIWPRDLHTNKSRRIRTTACGSYCWYSGPRPVNRQRRDQPYVNRLPARNKYVRERRV